MFTTFMPEFEKTVIAIHHTQNYDSGNSHVVLNCSAEEAGRYLETFKAYENKPPDLIMEKTESNFLSQVQFEISALIKLSIG